MQLRCKFLISLATNEAGNVNTASQWVVQCTLQTECQCKEAHHIKQVLNKASGGAIFCIKVSTTAGLIEVHLQAKVEHHMMDMCLA